MRDPESQKVRSSHPGLDSRGPGSAVHCGVGGGFEGVGDLLEELRGELLPQPQRGHVIIDLRSLSRANDRRRDLVVFQAPRERQRGHGAAELIGDRFEVFHLRNRHLLALLVHIRIVEERLAHFPGDSSAILGDLIDVLPGEHASGEGRPNRRPVVVVLEKRQELFLHLLSVEKVVLALIAGRRVQLEPLADPDGLLDLVGRPLGGAPVEGEALADQPVEGSALLLHWDLVIGSVREDHVGVVDLESLEGGLAALDDVLSGEANRVMRHRVGSVGAPENFDGDDELLAVHIQSFEALPGDDLGAALIPVELSGIEHVDPTVPGLLHDRKVVVLLLRVSEGHGPQREPRHFHPRVPEEDVLHLLDLLLRLLGRLLLVFGLFDLVLGHANAVFSFKFS